MPGAVARLGIDLLRERVELVVLPPVVEDRLRPRMGSRPLAGERAGRGVAAVAVYEHEPPEPLAVQRVEQVAQHRNEGLDPQRWAPREGREGRGQSVRQHRQHRHAERLRGVGRRALGEDVVGLEREIGVLLG